MSVKKAINNVSRGLAQIGIAKQRENKEQGYRYRGIDDFMNALSPLLVEHGLVILPDYKVTKVDLTGQTKTGTPWFTTYIDARFTFACVADDSTVDVWVRGEGRDNADKGANKAMSAAYKAMAAQVFCVPFGAMLDAEQLDQEPLDEPAQAMSEQALADHLAAVEAASDKESLTKARDNARAAAEQANDQAAYAKIVAAVKAKAKVINV
jgi:ERF superfamily